MNYKNILKTEFVEKEFEEALASDTSVLLGVSDGARDALELLGIYSVFDLASSKIFNNAVQLCDRSANNPIARFNLIPSDVVHESLYNGELDTVYQQSIDILDGIDAHNADLMRNNLGVVTVRDLAQWPPFQNIRQLLVQEKDAKEHFDDPDVPTELVPKFNEFPTEKVFYSVYLIDDVPDDVTGLLDLNMPFDLGALKTDSKYLKIRTGYILRYEQSWTGMGLALGNLLHSITLAPGESTRIAMVDWSRRQGVKTTEDISQFEALSNSLMQTRSISEVTSAVAREAQSGFSQMDANSTVSNNAYSSYGLQNPKETLLAMAGGAAIGGGAGALAGGVAGVGIGAVAGLGIGAAAAGIGAVPGMAIGAAAGGVIGVGSGALIGGTAGGAAAGLATANFGARSNNSSNTQVDVVTTTSSNGQRDLSSSMAQNIMDRTQQHSSSSRNKKASIVQEIRQEEKEQITTRVVTNYNHMHALTMNYFEVVQLYSAKVVARELTKCLYVPFVKILWTQELVERYKSLLIQNALSFDIAIALARPSNISLLINSTVNSFTTAEKQMLADPASDLQTKLDDFNARMNVGVSSNVLSPLYLPSLIGISKIETEWSNAEVFFELRDGRKVPSRITSYGQQQTTTYIAFSFKRRRLTSFPGSGSLPGFSRSSEEIEPSQEFTLPVVNNVVTLTTAYGTDISIPVDLNAGVMIIPPEVLYTFEDLFGSIPRPTGISVSFTQSQVQNLPSSVSYVDKRVNEIQKIVLRSVADLASLNASGHTAGGRPAISSRVLNVSFTFLLNGVEYPLTLPFKFREDRTTFVGSNSLAFECDLIEFDHQAIKQEVLEHLNFNSDYYTQKIFQSLGELEYANLVSQYQYDGKPLLNQVDIKPVALSGNYIIFKSKSTDDKAIAQWKTLNGYGDVKIEIIPLGTGGVFGEAVLGRANSAEKLDITRFWNWQDSPILITPPEIAPLQSGSRATSADVRPGSLDASLVSNMNPHALPDPQSLPAMLNALASANMFRDMSGIAQTAQLAQKSLEEAMKGATDTGKLSSSDLQKGLDFTKEIAGKVIQMTGDYGTLLANTGFGALTGAAGISGGAASKSGAGNSNASTAGALLNHGKKMDQEKKASEKIGDDSQNFEAPVSVSDGTGSDDSSGDNFEAPTMVGGGNEQTAYDNIVGSPAPTRQQPKRRTETSVAVVVNFKHQISGPLDGEFTIEFVGPSDAAFHTLTSSGLGSGTVSLLTGYQYAIQITGVRTKLPDSPESMAHIPVIAGNPAFDFDISKHITVPRVTIATNVVAFIPRGKKNINLTLVAEEASSHVTIRATISGSGSIKADLQAELEPSFATIKAGKITAGDATEVTIGGEVGIELPIEYKYLTGNVTLQSNDITL